MTHRRHHMYHNHVEKDYSHPWFTPEKMALEESWLTRFFHEYSIFLASFPYIGWTLYLFGAPDGNHFIPFPSDVSPLSPHLLFLITSPPHLLAENVERHPN
jgi:hypothetical protein